MALDLSGLKAFRAGLDAAIDAGVKQAAEYVGDLAQQLAPEDEGDLKASKKVEPGTDSGQWIGSFGDGLPDIRAVAQEYGTSDQPAQPYLTPALNQIDVKREIKAKLEELARRSNR